MIATSITIYVKPEFVSDFIKHTIENHENTRKEYGNIRFDFIQSVQDPSRFLLYEVFADEDAIAQHKNTEHYRKWKAIVEPWMAVPRTGVPHKVICPSERTSW